MKPMIEFRDVSFAVDEREILRDISFKVAPGTVTVILGPSGAGKSTILRLILALWKPVAGTVTVDNVNPFTLEERSLNSLRKKMGIVFQGNALFDSLTVEENVAYFLRKDKTITLAEKKRLVSEALSFVHLDGTQHLYPDELSGGMKKRVAVARAIIARPDIILFDEPTTGLDPMNTKAILELIIALRERGTTMIVVTHNINDGFRIGDNFVIVHDGKMLETGTATDIQMSVHPFIRDFLAHGMGEIPDVYYQNEEGV